jgi:hypothetical protein
MPYLYNGEASLSGNSKINVSSTNNVAVTTTGTTTLTSTGAFAASGSTVATTSTGTTTLTSTGAFSVAGADNATVGVSANSSSDKSVAISAVNAGAGAALVTVTSDDGIRMRSVLTYKPTVTAKTATATLTASEVVGGVISVTTASGAVALTLPTAADLVAAVKGVAVGDVLRCMIVAYGHGTNAVTIATAPSGATFVSDITLLSLVRTQYELLIRFTNVTTSSEAYSVY